MLPRRSPVDHHSLIVSARAIPDPSSPLVAAAAVTDATSSHASTTSIHKASTTARTSATPTATLSTSSGGGGATGVAVSLSILGFLAVIGVLFWVLRMKRRAAHVRVNRVSMNAKRSTIVPLQHPASRVTPFGPGNLEGPRFVHTPGANMRIAHRLPDGGWRFDDPRKSFAPSGVLDLDLGTPSASAFSTPITPNFKEEEAQLNSLQYSQTDYNLYPPPPAYVPRE